MSRSLLLPWTLLSIVVGANLVACNSTTPTSRTVTPGNAVATAMVRVSDGSQPVQLNSAGDFNVTLPAGALSSYISQLGPVNVAAQSGTASSLSAGDQAAAQAALQSGVTKGGAVLRALQLDISAAGSATKGFRTSQAALSAQLSYSLTLAAGTSCPSNTFVVRQIINGAAVAVPGQAMIDPATKLRLSGKATATLGSQHLAFLLLCQPVPPATAKANPLGLAKVIQRKTPPVVSAQAGKVVTPLQFVVPSQPFSFVDSFANILTVSSTNFSGANDTFFQDSTIGVTIKNYVFDVSSTNESNGGQDQAAEAEVTVTGVGTHDVSIDEELFPPMSDYNNVMIVTDNTAGTTLSLVADVELQNISLLSGDQLSVLRVKGMRTKQSTGSNKVDITSNPDGTWLVNAQGASTTQAAAQLLSNLPVVSGASLHNLATLLGLIYNQRNIFGEPTLTGVTCGNGGGAQGDQYLPATNAPGVTVHGGFTVQQTSLQFDNLVGLIRGVIQLRLQRLKA